MRFRFKKKTPVAAVKVHSAKKKNACGCRTVGGDLQTAATGFFSFDGKTTALIKKMAR